LPSKYKNMNNIYNENVMKYTGGALPEQYDLLLDEEDDIVVYDDSDEWYNYDIDSE